MFTNWGQNLQFPQDQVLAPKSLSELADAISANIVRPCGTLHSFSPVAKGDGIMLSSANLGIEPELDSQSKILRVGAANRFGDIALFLESKGFALKNMGSLPHISLAGAAATGTHGSGDENPILSTSLTSFSYLNHRGELVRVNRGDEHFEALRLGLGAYGLWIAAELSVVESFEIRQDIYEGISWDYFLADPARLTAAGYSVSLFGKWGTDDISQTWVKSKVSSLTAGKPIAAVEPNQTSRKELADGVGDNLTEQGGKPGPWLHRLPHFRLDANPSAGNEIQTEYFFERSKIPFAIEAVHSIAHKINPVLIISEIRSIAKDDAWLSPMRRADSIALHFTFKNDPVGVEAAVRELEEALAPFDPIPHWGKVHGFSRKELETAHPMLAKARAVFDELDPEAKFSSAYLRDLGIRS